MMKLVLPLSLALMLCGTSVRGQGLTPRPGMGQTPPKADTPAGPAEAAEEEKEEQPDLPPLPPWPGQETRKLQLFQLRGYFRLRADMHHNLNLGFQDSARYKAPFHTPASEANENLRCDKRQGDDIPVPGGGGRHLGGGDCPPRTLSGANLRLRLQPTINVGEQVRVHSMIDIFDNLVLGSTPAQATSDIELPVLQDGQAAPVQGQNANTAAILVKRAWAEVITPLGPLYFGRMPVHWGLGLQANDGNCWDCDYGDNSDRIMFQVNLAGHTLGMGYDFGSNGPTSFNTSGRTTYGGQAVDIEQLDDVSQWFWMLGRMDPEDIIQDRLDRRQLVFNYGLYLVWRKQDFDYKLTSPEDSSAPVVNLGPDSTIQNYADQFIERHAWTLMPDLWFKLMWGKLRVEFEGVLIAGEIGNALDGDDYAGYSILQFGWALRMSYKVLNDALGFGLELGMASGDQSEPKNADIDRRRWSALGRNADGSRINEEGDKLSEYRFDYDYHVDMILFRELLGTVANAIYFKPWIQYLLIDSLGARLDMIYSMAHRPEGFPGDSRHLGVELDLDIFYRNIEEKFFAGVQYGVLFPLGALDRPSSIFTDEWAGNAKVAHSLQARLIVRF